MAKRGLLYRFTEESGGVLNRRAELVLELFVVESFVEESGILNLVFTKLQNG